MRNYICAVICAVLSMTLAEYKIQCPQGEYLNTTGASLSYAGRCQQCPENTYWAMKLIDNNTIVSDVVCDPCQGYYSSPAGSIDITKCKCVDKRCQENKDSHVGVILGIFGAIIAISLVIGALFWCKTHGPEFLKSISGQDKEEVLDSEDDRLLHDRSQSPNLLDCQIEIQVTHEQLADEYNDITAAGDHNDMGAVLRAAVISEKRRSRAMSQSQSSMTSLNNEARFRAASLNAGYPPPPSQKREDITPLPTYDELKNTNHVQTVL